MGSVTPFRPRPPMPTRDACHGCGVFSWCLPANLKPHEAEQVERVTEHRRAIKRDGYLLRAGDTLTSLYMVHSGSVKTSITDRHGREQVTGFSLPGELVGIEAIDSGKYPCNVIALEDSSCCGIVYADLDRLSRTIPALQQHIHRAMSREITRDYGLMLLLGSMRAEERVAHFMLSLSKRLAARGYSESQFRLCMSRRDIGSYLGLALETVSRIMSRLKSEQILDVMRKEVRVMSPSGLRNFVGAYEARARAEK